MVIGATRRMPKVLVVEDNRSLASMAKAMIEDIPGFEAVVTANGTEARNKAQHDPDGFSVALVDLNLPDAPNGEIVPVLQSLSIPVIVLTGYFGEELRTKMVDLGVVDYVLKKNISAYEYVAGLVKRVHLNRSTKVLVVDDSPSVLSMLTRYLNIQCLNVITATNGAEALQRIGEHPDIKLVLTDYNMPVMDGFELILQLRARQHKDQLAIIGLSSSGESRLSAHFLKSGANDFISKPFSYEELLCRVNQNLDYLDQIAEIRESANRDYLTKLYNRRHFFSTGRPLFHQTVFQQKPVGVAMLDIDHFKRINDQYGHDAGDLALRHLAVMLSSEFSDSLVARFGGEEFCLLICGDPDATLRKLDAFRERVSHSPVSQDGHHFSFQVSIGYSCESCDSLDALISAADAKLYLAKQQGRNRVVSDLDATECQAALASTRRR